MGQHHSLRSMLRRFAGLIVLLSVAVVSLAACNPSNLLSLFGQSDGLYVSDLLAQPQEFNTQEVVVNGAYVNRFGDPAVTVLALGFSTLDNDLDVQPLGDQIWLEGFPEAALKEQLNQPGDSVHGFVRVRGVFETGGGFGPGESYAHRIRVTSAELIEQVRRTEERIPDGPIGEGQIAFRDLLGDPAAYNGQTITTRGYYFWNGPLAVLAEGVSVEEDGSSPRPIGRQIWMEGFPPDVSSGLNVGQGYVWGYVEVTGPLQSGGGFGKDGAYTEMLTVSSAQALEQK